MPIFGRAVALWPGLAVIALGIGVAIWGRRTMHLGLTLAFNAWWGIVLLVPLLIVMHRGVVLREERYLEQKFGETYGQYRSNVRRYL
jgi:protein-S-isoprenylcysteine O-methyltransferase Ste14